MAQLSDRPLSFLDTRTLPILTGPGAGFTDPLPTTIGGGTLTSMKATRYNADLTLDLVQAFIADYRKRDKRLYCVEAFKDTDNHCISVRMVALGDDDTFYADELHFDKHLCLLSKEAIYNGLAGDILQAADTLLAIADQEATP